MTLFMDFKPLTCTFYFTFPKFIPRSELQTGLKKEDTDCRKDGNVIMNIMQFIYNFQTKIYN